MERRSPRYRWLVTDLDGTLLDRRQRLVARSRRALERFQALGGRVVIATGRIESSALPYYRALDLRTPAILYNGARVCDLVSSRTLMRRQLPDGSVGAILRAIERVGVRCSVVVFAGNRAYVSAMDAAVRAYAARDGLGFVVRADLTALPASKVLLIGAEADQPALLAELDGIVDTHTIQSERTYLEVLPQGADKGSALSWLLRRNTATLDDVVAVGDGRNDLSMLAAAAVGACVEDAHPDVVAAADHVVSSCDAGGVADAVELAIHGVR